jgi:hypothetical protein
LELLDERHLQLGRPYEGTRPRPCVSAMPYRNSGIDRADGVADGFCWGGVFPQPWPTVHWMPQRPWEGTVAEVSGQMKVQVINSPNGCLGLSNATWPDHHCLAAAPPAARRRMGGARADTQTLAPLVALPCPSEIDETPYKHEMQHNKSR